MAKGGASPEETSLFETKLEALLLLVPEHWNATTLFQARDHVCGQRSGEHISTFKMSLLPPDVEFNS